MKNIPFIIVGITAGMALALFDTAVGNAEVSAIDPTIGELVGDAC